ncbi:MAG: PKD domain-containing protein [Chitinophagales bacterium]
MKRIFLVFGLFCFFYQGVQAKIYYVTNNHVTGYGSIGVAIDSANSHIGKDSIYFNIASGTIEARTITLSADSLLPNIKDTTVMDAKSQTEGSHFGNSTAKIQITSSDMAAVGLVIDINAKYTEIYGLFINHFSNGVKLLGDDFFFGSINNGNVVSDCKDICIKVTDVTNGTLVATFVGVDTSGITGTSPDAIGILIDNSKKVTLGGKQPNSRNVISGCYIGIKISDSKYITIQGNYVGTDLYATAAVPNFTGILATQSADGNTKNITIGGDSAKYLNVISGNLQRGLDLALSSSFIQGNMIGTDISGGFKLGNGSDGVYFRGGPFEPSHDNVVGGINPGEGNIIAYNGEEGVELQDAGAHNIAIRGNRMFCNSEFAGAGGIVINGGNQGVYPPTIVIVSNDFISGTSYPGALIDIYAADSCITCEGADYLTTILSDSNGIFAYGLSINAKVTVTANDTFGNSSGFSQCGDSSNTSCIFASFFKSKSKVCTDEVLTLSDQTISVPGDTIISWNWLFGDGQTSAAQNPVVTFSQGGVFAITLIATNTAGCSDTTIDSITVKDGVIANFVADQNVCLGTPVNFSDNSSALGSSIIVKWQWDLGDGNGSLFTDFQYTYTSPGDYSVTLNIMNNNNCSAYAYDTITVHDFPTADFGVSPDACAVTPIQFSDSTLPASGSTIVAWQWDFGDGGTSMDQNASHLYTASGNYLVTLISTDNFGCSDTTIQGITILTGAIANFAWNSNGLTVSFINTSTFNADYSLQWTFGDGTTSSLQTPTHTYNAFGSYEVCLIVNDFTCDMIDTLCQTVLITGINNINENSGITVMPNPASSQITINQPGSAALEKLVLFNTMGKEIILPIPSPTPFNNITIPLPFLAEGIYWLQISTTKAVSIRKLVIMQN